MQISALITLNNCLLPVANLFLVISVFHYVIRFFVLLLMSAERNWVFIFVAIGGNVSPLDFHLSHTHSSTHDTKKMYLVTWADVGQTHTGETPSSSCHLVLWGMGCNLKCFLSADKRKFDKWLLLWPYHSKTAQQVFGLHESPATAKPAIVSARFTRHKTYRMLLLQYWFVVLATKCLL